MRLSTSFFSQSSMWDFLNRQLRFFKIILFVAKTFTVLYIIHVNIYCTVYNTCKHLLYCIYVIHVNIYCTVYNTCKQVYRLLSPHWSEKSKYFSLFSTFYCYCNINFVFVYQFKLFLRLT